MLSQRPQEEGTMVRCGTSGICLRAQCRGPGKQTKPKALRNQSCTSRPNPFHDLSLFECAHYLYEPGRTVSAATTPGSIISTRINLPSAARTRESCHRPRLRARQDFYNATIGKLVAGRVAASNRVRLERFASSSACIAPSSRVCTPGAISAVSSGNRESVT